MGDFHARFCERVRVKLPRSTRPLTRKLLNRFADTQIYNMDFETFLRTTQPRENDFVFLDPPYDSEFCTYAKNAFTRDDQRRLADFMINECKAKWMMIIKICIFFWKNNVELLDYSNNMLTFARECGIMSRNEYDSE